MRLVNTLPLEEYLYGVVPSEMPASYPEEALKAQAVCARTYACVQMMNSSLGDLGAQVDDSVSYQVYQNRRRGSSSSQAVEATAGEILLNNGSPINAYYFSTSHGQTSTDQVWRRLWRLLPIFRVWNVPMTLRNPGISGRWIFRWKRYWKMSGECFQGSPGYQEWRWLKEEHKREFWKLVIHTDQGDQELHSEYDIRTALAPDGLSITRQDGSQVMGSSLAAQRLFYSGRDPKRSGNPYRL